MFCSLRSMLINEPVLFVAPDTTTASEAKSRHRTGQILRSRHHEYQVEWPSFLKNRAKPLSASARRNHDEPRIHVIRQLQPRQSGQATYANSFHLRPKRTPKSCKASRLTSSHCTGNGNGLIWTNSADSNRGNEFARDSNRTTSINSDENQFSGQLASLSKDSYGVHTPPSTTRNTNNVETYICHHGSAKSRILQQRMHYRSQQPPASQSRQKHHQDQKLGSLRPQCTLLVKCFSFLFSDTRRPLKLHNGGDHQHTRSQRSRIHHSTLPFEPHELQQLFLPNSGACWNPLLKADHV